MDGRQQSRALQNHLNRAKRSLKAGDRERALEALDSALAIDAGFLDARVLRDELLDPARSPIPSSAPPAIPPVAGPPEGWTRIEQRAREKRIAHRLAAARAALDVGNPAEATAAIDELQALAPDHPEIAPLAERLAVASAPASADLDETSAGLDLFQTEKEPLEWIEHSPSLVASVAQAPMNSEIAGRATDEVQELALDNAAADGPQSQEAALAAFSNEISLVASTPVVDDVRTWPLNRPDITTPSWRRASLSYYRLRRSLWGSWVAAAAALAFLIIGGSWLERRDVPRSGVEDIVLIADPQVAQNIRAGAADVADTITPVTPPSRDIPQSRLPQELKAEAGTTGAMRPEPQPREPFERAATFRRPIAAPEPADRPVVSTTQPESPAVSVAPTPVLPPAPAATIAEAPLNAPIENAPTPSATVVAPPPPAAAEAVTPVPAAIPPLDEDRQIRQVLDRYRIAYETLDAKSAQQVWPGVNEAALARAFNGLQSQSVTFDSCEIRIRGSAATAACSGTARYVPKVGSRFQRVEPRSWDFTLRKAGVEWKIEAARADR